MRLGAALGLCLTLAALFLGACPPAPPGQEAKQEVVRDGQAGEMPSHEESPETPCLRPAWVPPKPTLSACIRDPGCTSILAVGHRGTIFLAPENTVEAIQEAHRLGADVVEVDVKISKDGVPFLLHDGTVDRTTESTGDAEQKTMAELQALKLLCPKKAVCTGKEKIPTLEEALLAAKDKVILNLDMKTDKMAPVVAAIRKHKAEDSVFLYLSGQSEIDKLLAEATDLLFMPRASSESEGRSLAQRYALRLLHFDVNLDILTASLRAFLKEKGVRIFLNALAVADSVASSGGDGYAPLLELDATMIQTDRLDLLVPYLRQRNRLCPQPSP